MMCDDQKPASESTGPYSVECPVCGAEIGAGCFSRYQPQFSATTHVRRWNAAGLPAPDLDERIAVDVSYRAAAQQRYLAVLENIRHGR